MEYFEICESNYVMFHQLANAYYREGEDEKTSQDEIDAFIRFLFNMAVRNEIKGCLVKDARGYLGFALWTIDREDFAFSEIPGCGTILEIGIAPSYRGSGLGQEFVSFIETWLRSRQIKQCYVSAYGPAQKFWEHCGYAENGQKANNGLPIMIKAIN
ncbi:MAG: GNAT family N-acetyltransferase [Ruminococcaceae bacterium]|nr:GNAT family N-acetyltransferase [Oscillospiraceae bacterium]